jgi:chaperonin GroES
MVGATMNWKPTDDRVIVRKLEETDGTTSSGLVLVGTDPNDKHVEAEVVAVGPGKRVGSTRVPVGVSVGDTILYHKHYGTDLPVTPGETTEYMILHEEDIVGVVA